MKKLAVVLLSVLLLFSVVGCGNYNMMNDVKDEVKDEVNDAKDKVEDMLPSDNNSDMSTASTKITAEQAKQRALEHAGVKENDVYDFDIDKETENGVLYYDIDFETKDFDYDYLIDANTGEVKRSKKEINN
jgi:uncharacterized membrane protein YkoI